MPAPVLAADTLSKAYGGRRLFDDATFQVEEGDKVAVVGPNGAGKSTLLRILAGRERPDHGVLRIREGVRAHFFDQHPVVPKGATVRDLLASPLPVPAHLAAEKATLEARIADPALYEAPGYERVLERYAALETEIKRAVQPPVEAFSSPYVRMLGFSAANLDQPAASLSGGEKTRLFLARLFGPVGDHDLVVLDEPTNHLDVDTIEWLEGWLQAFPGTVLVVAHDRAFLDNVATRVFEVAHNQVTPYPGNYSDYVALRDEDVERQRRDHEKAIAELKKAEATIQQFRHQKRFDGQYASRMKMVERHRAVVDRTPDPVLMKVGFGLHFQATEKSSNEMIRINGVRKAFEGRPVLDGVDFEVKKGDRVGVVGPNGAGKSTLIKILTGRAQKDSGTIHVAPGVKGTLLTQEHEGLDPVRTLKEEVLDARPLIDDEGAKALIGRFGFQPEVDMQRKVATLSGGERGRMALLKAVLKPSNLLILDEPTNHMDLDSREVVARALNTYPGTLVVVSHDRHLLDSVTDSTAVVYGGRVAVFPGAFSATRPLHPRPGARERVVARDRYFVRKKFTDWSTERKYLHGEEPEFSAEEIEASRSLKNALHNGWLERR